MNKKLPIGIQTFKDIRDKKENYVYVDKTDSAYKLINKGRYFFLSRPRRFGKSLFVDTLDNIFSGYKELFNGLYIYDKWNWEETFPILRIDFTSGDYSSEKSIRNKLLHVLSSRCETHGLNPKECYSETLGIYLENTIKKTSQKFNQKVVVLIDEYDKPILDNITRDKKETAIIARDTLKTFYSAIKQSDAYIKFVFITGVSKFSKLNLFSGLNNLEDITINTDFATIAGYTQKDLETYFAEFIEGKDKEAIKKWYNGYNYFGESVYNPFDILLFFSNKGEFRNYWWGTGNPSFFIEKLQEGNYFLPNLENIEVTEEVLDTFDVNQIDLVALLWQTGYLTFSGKNNFMGTVTYSMKVPNLEIQNSLNALFFDYLTKLQHGYTSGKIRVVKALMKRDFQVFEKEIFTLFSSIPFDNYKNNPIAIYEGYYASVMFAFLSSIGFQVFTEDTTNKGRIDMTMQGHGMTLIVEFKVDMPAEDALHQIETRKYYEKYQGQNNEIYLIGIHFNSKNRNIESMQWKKL